MLRAAVDSDKDLVRTWRNHPQVRAVSLTQHEISPEEHAAWWDKTMADPTRRVLIYERQGEPSGVVTFFDLDADAGTGWWGYYLDNAGLEERGALFPAWMSIQRAAVKYARTELKLASLDGETLAANATVVDLNARLGFEEMERETRDIDGTPTEIIHTRIIFEENAR
ncbi:GNAT family N-acetyltransferase [Nigerium massiliense]|uniref:GNAT family N-acetyltransferase n=1 Tax=Nigerium massiliense TaxID=1522317 RepID=UPI000590E8DD|nr:GNAT family N-acetyltransferase [Nigerium massiliense]